MTESQSRRTLCASGAVLFARRMRLTNQERADMPMTQVEAIAIARDAKVGIDFRLLAIHRLMDIAASYSESTDLWSEIRSALFFSFLPEEIPTGIFLRFHNLVPVDWMKDWADYRLGRNPSSQRLAA